jgi:hypothetical protein
MLYFEDYHYCPAVYFLLAFPLLFAVVEVGLLACGQALFVRGHFRQLL